MDANRTAHLLKLPFLDLVTLPLVAFNLLRVKLPLREEANLHRVRLAEGQINAGSAAVQLTRCAGLSTLRWARNSALMYSSPSNRISEGRCLRCARNRRRYKGMGGNRAMGAGFRPCRPAWAASVAKVGRMTTGRNRMQKSKEIGF